MPVRRSLPLVLFTLLLGVVLSAAVPRPAAPDAPGTGGPSEAPADVGARVRAHVEFLADDLLEGREPGTRGYDVAARYVAAALGAVGVAPGVSGSYFQPVPLLETTRTGGRFSVSGAGGETSDLAIPGEAIVVPPHGQPVARVSGPLVYAGHGVSAPALGHDDYAGLDVRGKVVLVFSNAPARFPSDERAHFASTELKVRAAAERGAVGLVVASSPDDERRWGWARYVQYANHPRLTWVDANGRPNGPEPNVQVMAYVGPQGLERLFAGAGRTLASAQEALSSGKAGGYPLATSVTLEVTSTERRLESPNVIGVLRGSDPALAETHVVLTAHLDHVGIGAAVNGDTIYNGAYDNAVGSAVLLEVARALAARRPSPRRSVLFVFVTAEEKGLLGSEYFAERPPAPRRSLVANVNVDMPLLLEPSRDLMAFGAQHSTLEAAVEAAAHAADMKVVPDPVPAENLFVRSDQYSFVRAGVPAVFLATGYTTGGASDGPPFLRAHYHKPSDDLALPMDLESTGRFARVTLALTEALAENPRAPEWKAGNFFGETFGK